MPSKYVGMDMIKTPNDEKDNTASSDYLEFTLAQNTTIYVAYSSEALSLPNWMNGFTDTGDNITTMNLQEKTFDVYSKSFPAGCVNLGANKASGFTGGSINNYMVFYETTSQVPECTLDSKFKSRILSEGMTYYTDRSYTLTRVPSKYIGMDMIKTPNDEKDNTASSDYLTFTLAQNTTVYVAYSSEALSLPNWMKGFTDTGNDITAMNLKAKTFDVYSKSFPAGCVNLGANKASGFTGGSVNNYMVFYGTVANVPTSGFDFNIFHTGNKTVTQGGFVSNRITTSLLSGTSEPVTYSVSGLPSGSAAIFSQSSCAPNCSTVLNIMTTSNIPVGSYSIKITGVGGEMSKDIFFDLMVTATTEEREVCSSIYMPVCGVDGRVYSNACEAKK